MAAICSARPAASKIPPEHLQALGELLHLLLGLDRDHGCFFTGSDGFLAPAARETRAI
jgi:hypothetical protein